MATAASDHAGPSGVVARANPLIDPIEVLRRIDDPDLVVLDTSVSLASPKFDGDHRVRSGRARWAEEHIPGSRHLDLLVDLADTSAAYHFAQPSAARAAGVLAARGISDASDVVVYDRRYGQWAARAWWSLRTLGLDVRILDGGLAAWRRAGGAIQALDDPQAHTPADAETPSATNAPPTLRPTTGGWATREDVLDVLAGRGDATLVCALEPEQFAAQAPTRYSRRGHIPGSLNLPARSLIDAEGALLPPPRLRDALRPHLPAPEHPVIVYCGGGVSASLTALGLVLAGHTRVSVYDGSLEEWSADPSLPLEG